MKKLLRGGFVVTPRGSRRADVLLDGEKIGEELELQSGDDLCERGFGMAGLVVKDGDGIVLHIEAVDLS